MKVKYSETIYKMADYFNDRRNELKILKKLNDEGFEPLTPSFATKISKDYETLSYNESIGKLKEFIDSLNYLLSSEYGYSITDNELTKPSLEQLVEVFTAYRNIYQGKIARVGAFENTSLYRNLLGKMKESIKISNYYIDKFQEHSVFYDDVLEDSYKPYVSEY